MITDSTGHPVIEIVLPTFRMEAEETERFYPSKAKAIGDNIIAEELQNSIYDEEDVKMWSLNISDKTREAVNGIELLIKKKKLYNANNSSLHQNMQNLNEKLESLGKSHRYKIVVQTTIGQLRDQGIRVASRCLWDPNSDNYASCSYSNVTLKNFLYLNIFKKNFERYFVRNVFITIRSACFVLYLFLLCIQISGQTVNV